jgi:hypothetical protein
MSSDDVALVKQLYEAFAGGTAQFANAARA